MICKALKKGALDRKRLRLIAWIFYAPSSLSCREDWSDPKNLPHSKQGISMINILSY